VIFRWFYFFIVVASMWPISPTRKYSPANVEIGLNYSPRGGNIFEKNSNRERVYESRFISVRVERRETHAAFIDKVKSRQAAKPSLSDVVASGECAGDESRIRRRLEALGARRGYWQNCPFPRGVSYVQRIVAGSGGIRLSTQL
jgi:hypothetical protein